MKLITQCDDCNNHNAGCGIKGDLTRDNIAAGTYYSGNYELTLTCNGATSAIVDFVMDINNGHKGQDDNMKSIKITSNILWIRLFLIFS